MAFPSSIPSYQGYVASETLSAANNAAQLNQMQSDTIGLATKLGTGSSTPTSTSVLVGNGVGTSTWGQVNLSNQVTGLLPTGNGGTGTTSTTGSGSVVFNTSPSLTTPTVTGGTFSSPTTTNINNTAGLTNTGGLTTDTLGVTGATTLSTVTNKVLALNGNPVWQYLGYAQITTTFSTSSTSAVQVTGLTLTVTIPTGITKVRVSVFSPTIQIATGGTYVQLGIWDGTVGSGTELQYGTAALVQTLANTPMNIVAIVAPTAGSHTYNASLNTENGSNAASIIGTSTSPAFILVECC